MYTAELRDLFRADVDDTVAPTLWSDAEIASYADDAQKMFVRLTGGIRDASSSLCTLDLVAGVPFSDTDSRILNIVRIQRDSDAQPLRLANVGDMDTEGIRLDARTGAVTTAVMGLGANTLRWHPVPAAAGTASMIIERLPLVTITSARSTKLEIEEQHQRHLMLWMSALAYAKQDADTRDEARVARKSAEFYAYCSAAKAEKSRAQRKAGNVRYGGC